MKGQMKSLYGIYKKHGREAFLDAAKSYSVHVSDTIEDTLSEMESRWYDGSQTMTEAEKMIDPALMTDPARMAEAIAAFRAKH